MKALVAALALALTAGCVYQPIHVELYNATSIENADIGIDASRNIIETLRHEEPQ